MLFIENLILAMSGIRANRVRSLLTMLGIIIGISSVITIMTIGNLLTEVVGNEFMDLGSAVTIGVQKRTADSDDEGDDLEAFYRNTEITLNDDDMLTPEMVEDVYEQFSYSLTDYHLTNDAGEAVIKRRSKETKVSVKGVNNAAYESKTLKLLAGRLFTDIDQKQARKVAIISDKAVRTALGVDNEEAPGRQITLVKDGEFEYLTVVGVYHFDESSAYIFGKTDSTDLYVPVSTSFRMQHKKELYTSVDFRFNKNTDYRQLMDSINEYVNKRYYRRNEMFEAKSFSDASFQERLQTIFSIISMVIALIAGISLLVGGIGVMNIMLVSIQERTREIGTRKALGATNNLILMQFIAEAIMLCIIGGFIGCTLGILMGNLATLAYNLYFSAQAADKGTVFTAVGYSIPVDGVVIALVFSSMVGIFFGYYPAKKAAQMNPIDALRYE